MILLILPAHAPENGGNWIHAKRLQKGLRKRGWEVVIKTLENVDDRDLTAANLLHLFNAYRTGKPLMADLHRFREKRVIMTLTGTDVNDFLHQPSTREDTIQAMDWADHLVCIAPSAKRKLIQMFPQWREKVTYIPLALDLPVSSEDGVRRSDLGWSDEEVIFFLPAGLRPVKNPLMAVEPLGRLFAETKKVRFCIAGPPLERDILETLQMLMRTHSWITYLGSIPHSQISQYYLLSDVVLNTSRAEGLSHALLEGMFFGKPVLASRVPGNLDLVRHGVDGFLFSDAEEMYAYAKCLYEDPRLRMEMGREGKKRISTEYVPDIEWNRYHELYSGLLSVYICLHMNGMKKGSLCSP